MRQIQNINRNQSMFESQFSKVLIMISNCQQKMQSYRQLLNEQIQFNIKDLYMNICGNNAQVTAYHLHIFMTQQIEQKVYQNAIDIVELESMIKSYNNCTSLNLSFIQFALIFLSRQNKLLSKLTIQRNSLGEIPKYLLEYVKKIIKIQCQVHKQLIQFRTQYSLRAQQWIKNNSQIDEQTGQDILNFNAIQALSLNLDIDAQVLVRFFKVNQNQLLKSQKLKTLFTLKNSKKIQQFLRKHDSYKQYIKKSQNDPYIRAQFHDCLQRPKTMQNFSHREIKSIQKHLERLNSKSKNQIALKIKTYKTVIEKQMIILCQAINKIIKLQQEIEAERIQLSLCTDFFPVLFYDSFDKDRQMCLIPSSFKNYLQNMGIKVQINQLYIMFKRYSTRPDGKLSFNEFCSIFDTSNTQYLHIQKNRLVKKLQDIDLQTIKTFIKLIKVIVKNEYKIQKIKIKLQSEVDLREIFSIFDQDEDGYISMTDFRIIWRKYVLLNLTQQELYLFWHRMKFPKNSSQLIKYQYFISQMIPKAKIIQKTSQHFKKYVKRTTN